jgi:hypothetical protein
MVKLSNAEEAWVVAENELRATKQELADFRQEVSNIVHNYVYTDGGPDDWEKLKALIIPVPKPDPLFDALWDLGMADDRAGVEFMANRINDVLKARGLEIREKNDD